MTDYIARDASFVRVLTVEMFEVLYDAIPSVHRRIPASAFVELNINLFESVAIKYKLSVKAIAQLAYQVGYDGPLWQWIVKETPDVLSYINLTIFGHRLSMIKLSMLKTIFEHDKPSKRELRFIQYKLDRYDIQMYIYELLYGC